MIHYEKQSSKELRAGMGEGLVEAGRKNENVVALSADVKGSVKMDGFAKEFPERFIQCGIAEANMVGIAAGLSLCGKVPFIGGFAEFVTGRVYDQIRQVVCYSNKNVKICGSHAGISLGEDGATHQTMEDIALMKVLPNMTVLVPADFNQAKAATLAAAEHVGPVYLRLGRSKMPCFLPENEKFEIGKAQLLSEGTDVTLFACGHLVWEALQAAEMLEKVGISCEVINTARPAPSSPARSTSSTAASATAWPRPSPSTAPRRWSTWPWTTSLARAARPTRCSPTTISVPPTSWPRSMPSSSANPAPPSNATARAAVCPSPTRSRATILTTASTTSRRTAPWSR